MNRLLSFFVHKKSCFSFIFIMFFFLPFFSILNAEDSSRGAPQSPGVELPPVLLELEDEIVEDVDAALPHANVPEVLISDPKLPAADGLSLDEKKVDFLKEELEQKNRDGHYFDLVIGIGSLAEILAEITWQYVSPEGFATRLRIAHDHTLFWNYRPMSENGQAREESISFSFDYNRGLDEYSLDFSFKENQLWFQNRIPGVSSASWRFLNLKNYYQRELTDRVYLKSRAGLETVIATEGYYNFPFYDFAFTPGMGLQIQKDQFRFDLDFDYRLANSNRQNDHLVQFLSQFEMLFDYKLLFSGSVGFAWTNSNRSRVYIKDLKGVSFPFSVGLSGKPLSYFNFDFETGYRIWTEEYRLLYDQVRWIKPINLSFQQGWFFKSDFIFPILKKAEIMVGLDFQDKSNQIALKTLDEGYIGLSQNRNKLVFVESKIEIFTHPLVHFNFGWKGEVFSSLILPMPEHQLKFKLDWKIPQKWFGGDFNFQFDFYEEAKIPHLGVNFFFEIKEGYRIRVEGRDLISAACGSSGRIDRGFFIEEGANVAILAEFSF